MRVQLTPSVASLIERASWRKGTAAAAVRYARKVKASLLAHGQHGPRGPLVVLSEPVESGDGSAYYRHVDDEADFKAYYRVEGGTKTVTFVAISFGTQDSLEAEHAYVPDDPTFEKG